MLSVQASPDASARIEHGGILQPQTGGDGRGEEEHGLEFLIAGTETCMEEHGSCPAHEREG